MTEELKSKITAISAAIMRRVEFDQCIHASSIEDEIGKWVREVFAEPDYHQMAWSGYAEKMEEKVAEKSVIDDIMKSRATQDGYFKVGDVSCGLVLTEKDGLYEWKPVDYEAEGKKWLAQVDADLRVTGYAFMRTDNQGKTTVVPALDVLKPAPTMTATEVSERQDAERACTMRIHQALAQQMFNQQIADAGLGGCGTGLRDMPLTTAADMVIGREASALGQIIEVIAKSDGTVYRRYA